MWDDEGVIYAKNVIKEQWYESYKKHLDIFHNELIYLNSLIFYLERIERFPLIMLFELEGDRAFIRTTNRAIAENVITIFWRLLFDQNRRALTLPGFKSDIENNLISSDAEELVAEAFADFQINIEVVRERVERARHNFLAHFNRELNVRALGEAYDAPLALADLKVALETTVKLFNSLSFETYHSLWIWDYSEQNRQNETTDIDNLLKLYASSSSVMHLPEEDSESWDVKKQTLRDNDIQVFNKYRLKLGLPPV